MASQLRSRKAPEPTKDIVIEEVEESSSNEEVSEEDEGYSSGDEEEEEEEYIAYSTADEAEVVQRVLAALRALHRSQWPSSRRELIRLIQSHTTVEHRVTPKQIVRLLQKMKAIKLTIPETAAGTTVTEDVPDGDEDEEEVDEDSVQPSEGPRFEDLEVIFTPETYKEPKPMDVFSNTSIILERTCDWLRQFLPATQPEPPKREKLAIVPLPPSAFGYPLPSAPRPFPRTVEELYRAVEPLCTIQHLVRPQDILEDLRLNDYISLVRRPAVAGEPRHLEVKYDEERIMTSGREQDEAEAEPRSMVRTLLSLLWKLLLVVGILAMLFGPDWFAALQAWRRARELHEHGVPHDKAHHHHHHPGHHHENENDFREL